MHRKITAHEAVSSYNRSKLLNTRAFRLTPGQPRVHIAVSMTRHRATDSPQYSPLGQAHRGFRGRIHAIDVPAGISDLPAAELEGRLIELGFTEGAYVEILHEGVFGRDPIAVRVNDATVALRRREAMAILVI